MPGAGALAAASGWSTTEQTQVRLLSTTEAVGNSATLTFGAEFRLKEGWKTYWRSPGDAGFPMEVDWSGSRNVAGLAVQWPAATRFSVLGLTTIGYKDEVVFPLSVTVAEPGQPVHLAARISYLTCDDVCIPYTAELALDLPAGPAQPSPEAPLVARYLERLPQGFAAAGLTLQRLSIGGHGTEPVLEASVATTRPFGVPDLYVEGGGVISGGVPDVSLAEDGRTARFRVPLIGDRLTPAALSDKALTLTLVDGGRAAEISAIPAALGPAGAGAGGAPGETAGETAWGTLTAMLLTALAGGLILNLMPCVLPVLSLKLLSLVGQAGAPRRRIRASFLASAAGIVSTFLVLAAAAIGLRQAGLSVVQGMQFQQPVFLVAMMGILVAFAVNLFGRYEILLPGRLGDAMAGRGAEDGSLGGAFLTGALATVLATPCSAPFVGTALGFALSRGPLDIVLVFAALGLGLALPYLAVAALPGLASRLPRPGRWMIVLRRLLGVALLGTALWLGGVLLALTDPLRTAAVAALLLALGGALWLVRRLGRAGVALAGTALVAALVVPGLAPPPQAVAESVPSARWQAFDRDAIAPLVAAGRTVLVDVTADWCLTCQVNKKLVLDTEAVRARLDEGAVATLRADWTRPSDDIARYLASFNRYGIPFNVVYGPAAPEGIVLPELLTAEALDDALARAAGR